MVGPLVVDDVHHRCQRGGFSGTDRAGDQHQSVAVVEQTLDVDHVMVHETEFFERADVVRHQAVTAGDAVLVHHQADAEAVLTDLQREAQVHGFVEPGEPLR